ncbi:MAG: CRISPR-associated protein Cas4 [Thermotogae bacterium]|nr:CRISPR-associated protein Cas4 [Thermotogota bacterium]
MTDEIVYTGVQVSYYRVCKRKLWLFSKGLMYEKESEDVAIGRLLDALSYKRYRKEEEIVPDRIKVDFITLKNGIVINEVKKSKSLEDAHALQVKYYMWAFKKRGVKVLHALIRYPRLRRVHKVHLSPEDEAEIERILEGISKVLSEPLPPEPINAKYCKRCAYYDFCYG